MEYFIHVANILYIFSYIVRDILWLRILIVAAISCVIPFYYFQPVPLMEPIYWNLVFISINIVQITILLLERRPVQLSSNEQNLYKLVFRTLTPREAKKLFELGQWHTARKGVAFVEQGSMLDELMLINEGEASVQIDGNEVATLGAGHFVGEMSYITGNKTSASVVANEELQYVTWSKQTLRPFLNKHKDLNSALTTIIGIDLVGKLSR